VEKCGRAGQVTDGNITGTLHKDILIYDIISLNFRKKMYRKTKHILCSIIYFPPKTVSFVR
jgi:hypothetical protein